MSWKTVKRAANAGPFALFGCLVVILVPIFLFVGAASFLANPFLQTGRIVNKTIDADNVIANYEWFKQRHEDIGAIDSKIIDAEMATAVFRDDLGDRGSWHREDRVEYSRLSAITLGLKQQRADLAAEYNARSRMVNRNVFKAGDGQLPERID